MASWKFFSEEFETLRDVLNVCALTKLQAPPLKTKPVTASHFFSKNIFINHRRRNREIFEKKTLEKILLKIKNWEFPSRRNSTSQFLLQCRTSISLLLLNVYFVFFNCIAHNYLQLFAQLSLQYCTTSLNIIRTYGYNTTNSHSLTYTHSQHPVYIAKSPSPI